MAGVHYIRLQWVQAIDDERAESITLQEVAVPCNRVPDLAGQPWEALADELMRRYDNVSDESRSDYLRSIIRRMLEWEFRG